MWRVGLCESTGEELFWVRVDTSCVTLHFAFFFFSGVGRSGNYSLQVRFGPLGVFCIVMSSEQFSHLYSAKCWGE